MQVLSRTSSWLPGGGTQLPLCRTCDLEIQCIMGYEIVHYIKKDSEGIRKGGKKDSNQQQQSATMNILVFLFPFQGPFSNG